MLERDDESPRSSLKRPSPLPWIILGAAILAGGAFMYLRMRGAPPAPAPAQPAAEKPQEAEPSDAAAAAGEGQLAQLLPRVSSDPLYQRAIAFPDFIRRAAVVIDNLSEGVSPRRELAFLAPKGEFQAARLGKRLTIDPASYARYDGFAAAVSSVDVAALGAAYRAGKPALQAAYRMLGYPGPALDRAITRGLRRIADAPVREGEVEVVDEGGIYVLADRKLEALPEVEKHLLRMGPVNTRVLQAKARAIAAELGLDLTAR